MADHLLLRGKVAFVTGGGSGIGRAVAIQLAKAGAAVSVGGMSESANEETLAHIRAAIGTESENAASLLALTVDVRKDDQVGRAIRDTSERLGNLHIGICCAGVEAESGLLEGLTIADYSRVFDVHVMGTFLTLKHLLPAIRRAGGGSVITTASTGGLVGFPGAPLYCAAKHAVVGLTKVAALDYAVSNIRVNAVAPSVVDTPMFQRFIAKQESAGAVREQLASAHPLSRIATAAEIAECFVFLASDQSRYVTGQTLIADGGYTAR